MGAVKGTAGGVQWLPGSVRWGLVGEWIPAVPGIQSRFYIDMPIYHKAKMLLLDVFTTDQSFLNQMITQQLRDLHESLSHL